MIGWIQSLARVTALQLVRDRVPLLLLLYAAGCATVVPVASAMSLGAATRGAWDAALVLQWWTVMAAAGWCGLRTVPLELTRGAAPVFLSAPQPLAAWAIGRWLGGTVVLLLLTCGTSAIGAGASWALGLTVPGAYAFATLMIGLQALLMMTAIAALGTRTLPTVAVTAGATWVLLGTFTDEAQSSLREQGLPGAAHAIHWLVPHMDRLSLHTDVVLGTPVDPGTLARAVALALTWIAALALAGLAALHTRDLA